MRPKAVAARSAPRRKNKRPAERSEMTRRCNGPVADEGANVCMCETRKEAPWIGVRGLTRQVEGRPGGRAAPPVGVPLERRVRPRSGAAKRAAPPKARQQMHGATDSEARVTHGEARRRCVRRQNAAYAEGFASARRRHASEGSGSKKRDGTEEPVAGRTKRMTRRCNGSRR